MPPSQLDRSAAESATAAFETLRDADAVRLPGYDIEEIQRRIPHRPPFLMVDRVTERIVGQRITGYKLVSMAEPCFEGHFPDKAIFPGVLQVEALAQLAGLLVSDIPECQGLLGVFTQIEKLRFRRMVVPGDRLDLVASVIKCRHPLYRFEVRAYVGETLTTEGEIGFSLLPLR